MELLNKKDTVIKTGSQEALLQALKTQKYHIKPWDTERLTLIEVQIQELEMEQEKWKLK